MRIRICLLLALILLALSCGPALGAQGGGGLAVKPVGAVVSFDTNKLRVSSPEEGELTVVFGDKYGEYRHLVLQVPAGESEHIWDGLSDNGQKLGVFNNTYTLWATLRPARGEPLQYTATFELTRPRQTLYFALPSAPVLYLGGARDRWFVELQTVRLNQHTPVHMQVCPADDPEHVVCTREIPIKTEEAFKYYWNGSDTRAKKPLPAGDYILTFWMAANPEYRCSFTVTLAEGTAPDPAVAPTGPVMPAPDMTDEELWALMQQPSVVVDITDRHHQDVYEEPSLRSRSLGTLHGQTQCLEVLSVEGSWARVSAWIHEECRKVTGYVPLARLKVVEPQGPYGVLVDKADQVLILYENGQRIASIPVSTGLATETDPERETTPGCFLTSERIGDFASERRHYTHVIRYDGGNLIHSVGFQTINRRADFREQQALLGQKASHGCVRVPNMPVDGSGVDAWWLYTHLPYHTRVIILDDTPPESKPENAPENTPESAPDGDPAD